MLARTTLLLLVALGSGAGLAWAQSAATAASAGGAAVAPAGSAASLSRTSRPVDTPFQTVHQFNLSEGDLPRLVEVMRQYNALFVRLGHPEGRYTLWKLRESSGTRPAYLWQSTWPSQASYDAVHADTAFQALLRSTFAPLTQLLKDHTYGQYQDVPLERPQP